jgi:hypothetical protein
VRRRGEAIAIAVAATVIGGALALSRVRPEPPPDEARALAASIGQRARETAARVDERLARLAALPRLMAALATDSATIGDLRDDELGLALEPGEVVELGQHLRDGTLLPLARRPSRALPVRALGRGPGLRVVAGRLFVTDVTGVRPSGRADELSGVVALARAVELDDVMARLRALGVPASIVVGDVALTIGDGAADAAQAQALVLPGGGKVLLATMPPSPVRVGAGLALAVAGWLAALGWARRARPVATVPAAEPVAGAAPGERAPLTLLPATGEVTETSVSGRTFDRYVLTKAIGHGGMADVYLARLVGEAGFAKRVALKLLRPEFARDALAVDYFLDEARLQAQVDHPNIVQIADLGRCGNEFFIAMEWVDGVDLARIVDAHSLARQPVPVPIAVAIARQICAGLHAAHIATDASGAPLGLVHRDVKSANVLVSGNGVAKLGDFGIAKARERVRKTQVGEVIGTVEYMAPEQRTGGAVDARADQYGVAAIAYELLSGETINLDLARLAHLGSAGWPHLPPLRERRNDVPAQLDACLFRALSFRPEDRFESCAALQDALEAVAHGNGIFVDLRAIADWFKERESLWATAETMSSNGGTRRRLPG